LRSAPTRTPLSAIATSRIGRILPSGSGSTRDPFRATPHPLSAPLRPRPNPRCPSVRRRCFDSAGSVVGEGGSLWRLLAPPRKKVCNMKVTMMLADYAQAVGNKLYICDGGWSITGPVPTPSALALDIKVPWDEREHEHALRLDLLDSDGQPVLAPTPEGVQPISLEAKFGHRRRDRRRDRPHRKAGNAARRRLRDQPWSTDAPTGWSLRVAVDDQRREPRRLAGGVQHSASSGPSRLAVTSDEHQGGTIAAASLRFPRLRCLVRQRHDHDRLRR
jgi:hypothetical protein